MSTKIIRLLSFTKQLAFHASFRKSNLISISAWTLFLSSLFPLITPITFLSELLANFYPFFIPLSLCVMFFCVLPQRRTKISPISVLLYCLTIVICLIQISPYIPTSANALSRIKFTSLKSETTPVKIAKPLRLLSTNLLRPNTAYRTVTGQIAELNPDCFVAMELNKKWTDAIKKFLPQHKKLVTRRSIVNGYGIGLFCKEENIFVNYSRIITLEKTLPPMVEALLTMNGVNIHLLGLHTKNPITYSGWKNRQLHLDYLANYVKSKNRPTIAIGDFNTPIWTPSFKRFIHNSQFQDTRIGYGLKPTWSPFTTKSGLTILSMLPIDHALIHGFKKGTIEYEFSVVPIEGSDHQGILLDLSVLK